MNPIDLLREDQEKVPSIEDSPSSPLYLLGGEFTLPSWLLLTDHSDPWPGYTSTYGNHDWCVWKRRTSSQMSHGIRGPV